MLYFRLKEHPKISYFFSFNNGVIYFFIQATLGDGNLIVWCAGPTDRNFTRND